MRLRGLAVAARLHRVQPLALADSVACRQSVDLIDGPEPVRTSLRHAGCRGRRDLVATTAVIRIGGRSGSGCVGGNDPAGAVAVAICGAAGGDAADMLAVRASHDRERRARRADGVTPAERAGGLQLRPFVLLTHALDGTGEP